MPPRLPPNQSHRNPAEEGMRGDSAWSEIAKTFGLPAAFFAFVIWAGVKRWWVFGWTYDDLSTERDYWREAALSGTRTADVVTEYAVQQRASRDAASARAVRRRSIAEEATHLPPARPRRSPQ